MSELLRLVKQDAAISAQQAELAVATVLRFLAVRLPSPVVGQISAVIAAGSADDSLAIDTRSHTRST